MRVTLASVGARHAAGSHDTLALQSVDLRLNDGEQLAIIGPSGAGKTTLLHVMACALRPRSGTVRLDETLPWDLSTRALQRLRGTLFLAPQVPPLPPRQRVVTAVLAGRLPTMGAWASLRSLFHPNDLPAAHAALARFDLDDKLFERVDRLSGGERQRVGLARALLAPARLWLVDEPLSSLDPTRARQALAALTDGARERGVTLVTTLHQVDAALAGFPRVVGLRDGRVAFDLPSSDVTPALLARLYAQENGTPDSGAAWRADDPPDDRPVEASPPRPASVAMQCR